MLSRKKKKKKRTCFAEALKEKLSFSKQNWYLQTPVCVAVFYTRTHVVSLVAEGPLWPCLRFATSFCTHGDY